jgi:hypothetical protein
MQSLETQTHTEAVARPDRVGIFASALCAVHCALSTVIVGVSGFGSLLASVALERAFFVVAVSVAFYALLRGRRRHGRDVPLAIALVGLVPLSAARFVHWPVHSVEAALSIVGAIGLISAHMLNLQYDRDVCDC